MLNQFSPMALKSCENFIKLKLYSSYMLGMLFMFLWGKIDAMEAKILEIVFKSFSILS